jgi:hypothetical protein
VDVHKLDIVCQGKQTREVKEDNFEDYKVEVHGKVLDVFTEN